jgi:radical SAM superfamily enzyme YgiQ (UPF0313 family)
VVDRKTRLKLLADEIGAYRKDHGGKLRVALAYPNTYRVAMSNLGFHAVYTYLNGFDDIVCERFFLPEEAARLGEPEMQREPLRSFESDTPVADFDLVAFSVPFENDFPNLVRLLRLARIPVWQRDRREGDPIVMMGGSTAYLNPEPVADFMDVVGLGEAEGILPELLGPLRRYALGELPRAALLEELAALPQGFYVPHLHTPESILSESPDPSDPLKRRFLHRAYLKDLTLAPSYTRIVTPNTVFGHLYNIEIMRGCPARCRFCSVKTTQNPVRAVPLEMLEELIDRGLELTGRVGLLGPSVTAHPAFDRVLEHIFRRKGSFSLPSVRIEDLSERTVRLASDAGVRTITIAPESGDIELRAALGKYYPNERILEVARWVFAAGIPNLKLYFMYGVPTETDHEIDATIELVRDIAAEGRRAPRRVHIEASINPFIPKAQTNFQWSPLCGLDTLKRRGERLTRELGRLTGVSAAVGGLSLAPLQMAFSRGDRRASAIVEAIAGGGRSWKATFRELGGLLDEMIGAQLRVGAPLPWDHIVSPRLTERLARHYEERVLRRPVTGSCSAETPAPLVSIA